MINIVTKKREDVSIGDVETYFDYNVRALDFADLDLEIMKRIDNAELLDRSNDSIRTVLGGEYLNHLSTGCKTVLCYLYLKRINTRNIVLDVTECDYNALEVLFDIVERLEDSDSIFVLRHKYGVVHCTDRDFYINGSLERHLRKGLAFYG